MLATGIELKSFHLKKNKNGRADHYAATSISISCC